MQRLPSQPWHIPTSPPAPPPSPEKEEVFEKDGAIYHHKCYGHVDAGTYGHTCPKCSNSVSPNNAISMG